MRTIRNIAAGLVLATSIASCAIEPSFENVIDSTPLFEEVSLWAICQEDGTKSALGEGGAVLWSPNDSISVFYGNQYQQGQMTKFVSDNSSLASSARFSGYLPAEPGPEGSDGYYYAFYPYDDNAFFSGGRVEYIFPNTQFAKKGSFGSKAFPTFARSKDRQMFFYNVCGGIKLTVTKHGVQKISFKSNGGEILSGRGTIAFDENERPVINGFWDSPSSSVDLIAPEGGFEVGAPYYVILPPNTYSQGFTVTFYTDTEKAVRNIGKSVTIERSIFSRLSNADESLTYTKIPSAIEMLSGTDGIKYWLWDIFSESDGTSYGSGANNGNGYVADDGVVPGKWWGSIPESLADTESSFAYMTIDSNANCISYSEGGKEVRKGKLSITDFSPVYRADGWSLGRFTTDTPAILWPYADQPNEAIAEFEILRLTENELILAYNDYDTTTGSKGQYHWWRFRSVDKSTFEKGRPTGITIDQTSLVTYQGFNFKLNATVTPGDRSFWGTQWMISGDNVYRNQDGSFWAGEPGVSTVTAKTAGGLSASCEITVKSRIPVESFSFEQSYFELLEGETATLKPTVLPVDATLREVEYEVNDPSVATVGGDGTITAVGSGWTNIIAKVDGGGWQNWLTVYVRDKRVEGISLDEYYIKMYPGDKKTLTATIYPDYAANQNVIWSSLDEAVATVDANGVVTAVAPGWTSVKVVTEESGYESYCSVEVIPRAVSGLTLDITSAELFVGEKILLTATILPENATNQGITWRSDKTDVATVDKYGLVRAVGSGTATITATSKDGSFSASCKLTIRSNGVEPGIGDWEEGEHHDGDAY